MYRDPRTDAAFARVQADPELRRLVYDETGIQFLHFNTLYQLIADRQAPTGRFLHDALATGLLLMGDYFNWLLSGVAKAERSLASTSQLYNPRTRGWSDRLVETFDLRGKLLPELVDSGTILGSLRPDIAEITGLRSAQVIASCSHDTAAAVAATPLAENAAYLSSGTWSLLGVEVAEPIITDESRELGFTNEVGFGHTIRLLKNISGLFILQECRRELSDGGREIDYPELARLAREAPAMRSLIRPDAPEFGRVGGMTGKIADYCRRTNQPVPQSPGELGRCVYDSLSLLYARTLGQIERLTGRRIATINVVGGGSRSELLNQLTADACEVVVEAGPAEATALGNIGIQSMAMGGLDGPDDLRAAVRRSFEVRRFEPSPGAAAAKVRERFEALPPD
jgi:rhamnulokinase